MRRANCKISIFTSVSTIFHFISDLCKFHLNLPLLYFENRKEALRQKLSREKTILPFVTQYQPSVPSLINILMKHWQLIEKQPLLRQIYKEPPIISYKRGRSLKDIVVKAKLWDLKAKTRGWKAWVRLVNPYDISMWSLSDRPRSTTCEYNLWMSCSWAHLRGTKWKTNV